MVSVLHIHVGRAGSSSLRCADCQASGGRQRTTRSGNRAAAIAGRRADAVGRVSRRRNPPSRPVGNTTERRVTPAANPPYMAASRLPIPSLRKADAQRLICCHGPAENAVPLHSGDSKRARNLCRRRTARGRLAAPIFEAERTSALWDKSDPRCCPRCSYTPPAPRRSDLGHKKDRSS